MRVIRAGNTGPPSPGISHGSKKRVSYSVKVHRGASPELAELYPSLRSFPFFQAHFPEKRGSVMERIHEEEKHGTSTVGPCMVNAIDMTGKYYSPKGRFQPPPMPMNRGSKVLGG